MTEASCPICLGDVESPTCLCVDAHEPTCRECISSYVTSTVSGAFFGSCPVISCPSSTHLKSKRRKVIPMERWQTVVTNDIANRYKSLASQLLAFLCGGCHTLKTLDGGHEPNRGAACYEKVRKAFQNIENGEARFTEFSTAMTAFCLGEVDVETFYRDIQTVHLRQLAVMSDAEAWDLFGALLKTIHEPERRCNLHLRYLRDRPRMKTLCCNREHCFSCKIKDFHEGRTCLEYSSNLDNSIVTCPSCGIALARGDGCNTITCVCGKQFSWSAEKENTERCQAFLAANPINTSERCAQMLCTVANPPGSTMPPVLLPAKAWQGRNRFEVNRGLRAHFKRKYSPFPSQCCATLVPEHVMFDGIREAIELWKVEFSKDVARCKQQNEIALASIFTTMYPLDTERPIAAHKLVTLSRSHIEKRSVDPKLVQSATKWIEQNRVKYAAAVEQFEERSARQFLHLYGKLPLSSVRPAQSNFPSVTEFDRRLSNTDLTFTREYTTAQRAGSVSCYPAAFAVLPADRSVFRVNVDAAPRSSNWLTFGLARKGMPASSSDGVGRTANTWGISDDRSSSSNHTIVASCGSEAAQFRKLRVGDVLTGVVDTQEGWFEVSVNDGEFTYRFTIPAGASDEYVFAMTFANDHVVSVVPDGTVAVAQQQQQSALSSSAAGAQKDVRDLNPDHTGMLQSFTKQLKTLITEPDNYDLFNPLTSTSTAAPASSSSCALATDGSVWLVRCGGNRTQAREQFEVLKPALEYQLRVHRTVPSALSTAMLQSMDTYTVLEAASWYRSNRDQLRREQANETAINYSLIHGESAAFLAAMTVSQFMNAHGANGSRTALSSIPVNERVELEAAVAYMRFFEDEMNVWYEQDAASREPLVEHIVRGCRCLPRHQRSCPVVNANR